MAKGRAVGTTGGEAGPDRPGSEFVNGAVTVTGNAAEHRTKRENT